MMADRRKSWRLVPLALALLMLAAMSEFARFGVSENAAAGIGLCVLLVLVAIGVALLLTCAAKVRDFDFLEKVPFETEYGVSGMVSEGAQAGVCRHL